MESKIYYTPKQIAEILQLDTEAIYRYLNSGKLKGYKIAESIWRITQEDLDNFIKGEK
jgi:excisionase family DNA binding protein